MNGFQIAYTLALAVIIGWRGLSFVTVLLAINLAATLGACWAFDLGAMDRDGLTRWMMVIDLAAGSVLAVRPGAARLVAVGYALTVPLYALPLGFGVQLDTTLAIVYIVASAQLMVAAIGPGSGDTGGGRRGRRGSVPAAMAVSQRDCEVVAMAGDGHGGIGARGE